NMRLEHRGIERGFAACEGEISLAERIERAERIRSPVIPRLRQHRGEALVAPLRDGREQCVGIAEVAIGRGRTDTREPRHLRDGERARSFFREQHQRGIDQRLAQIAVVIAAPLVAAFAGPAHVTVYHMSWPRNPADSAAGAVIPERDRSFDRRVERDQPSRFSIASQTFFSSATPSRRLISWMPVGEVTLISVRSSPITSMPTKINPWLR